MHRNTFQGYWGHGVQIWNFSMQNMTSRCLSSLIIYPNSNVDFLTNPWAQPASCVDDFCSHSVILSKTLLVWFQNMLFGLFFLPLFCLNVLFNFIFNCVIYKWRIIEQWDDTVCIWKEKIVQLVVDGYWEKKRRQFEWYAAFLDAQYM